MSHPTFPVHKGPRSARFSPSKRRWGLRSGARQRFVEATGKSFNTVYPNDFGFWELVHELVQQEPPDASDPDLLGLLASVGIVHGQPFEPDAPMRKILEEAAVVGNATARTVLFAARPEEGFAFYPDSASESALLVGHYQFLDPPPQITADGVVTARATAPASSVSRTTFFYMAAGSRRRYVCASPASVRSTSTRCATARRVLRRRTRLPPHASADIPESRFWSVTLRPPDAPCCKRINHCRAWAASGTVETNPDGSTDIYSARRRRKERRTTGSRPFPARAGGRFSGSTPGPAVLQQDWRPSEIEPVT